MKALKHGPPAQAEPSVAKDVFSRFKDSPLAKTAAAAAMSAAITVPAAVSLAPAVASSVELPSSVVWVSGIDMYKKPVRDYFRSNPVSSQALEQEMRVGQMYSMTVKVGYGYGTVTCNPYTGLEQSTGMCYNTWIYHGFFYAGGDSLKYVIKYSFENAHTMLREHLWAWEMAMGTLPNRDARWSSGHPSYASAHASQSSLFPIMTSLGRASAGLRKEFSFDLGAIIDTNGMCRGGSSAYFNRAWNYGQGNWGNQRRWIGISATGNGADGIGFFDDMPESRHQLRRPQLYYLPKPDGSNHFLGWVGDTVFWKVPPSDTAAPYDVTARVDSVRFVFAELNEEMFYVRPYPLEPGEVSRVTARPYDVFKLPIPERLVPFSGYGNRKGKLVDPYYQFANIGARESFDNTLHSLALPAMEILFYQDSTAKCGPWYTRMAGRMLAGGTLNGITDNTPQFSVDSLRMERFVAVPQPGDTTFLTLGDEFNFEFRVPDSLYGAHAPYDPILTGYLYGKNYAVTGSASVPAARPAQAGYMRRTGPGRFELGFGDNETHRVTICDVGGRQLYSGEIRGRGEVSLGAHSASAIYIISVEGAQNAAIKAADIK